MSTIKYKIIHISQISESETRYCLSLMTRQRRLAVDRLRFEDDKKRTVAGELLAKRMIAEQCRVPLESIKFERTDRGKPFAVGLPVEFSISHSKNLVLCAVSDCPIGADIQAMRPVSEKLIRRVCTEREWAYTAEHQKTPEEVMRRFFRVWTGKEAYLKFTGMGIVSLNDTDIFRPEIHRGLTCFIYGNYTVSIFSESITPPEEWH